MTQILWSGRKKKRQEDKIVMQTRLPGETDASNILGSEGILLKKKKKNKATQTEYTLCVLWMVLGTTADTQSTRGSLKTSGKDSRGELEMRK